MDAASNDPRSDRFVSRSATERFFSTTVQQKGDWLRAIVATCPDKRHCEVPVPLFVRCSKYYATAVTWAVQHTGPEGHSPPQSTATPAYVPQSRA